MLPVEILDDLWDWAEMVDVPRETILQGDGGFRETDGM